MTRISILAKENTVDSQQPAPNYWNTHRVITWAEEQPMLDRLFLPFEHILTDAVVAEGPSEVLDIGCGTGATTLAIAQKLAPNGRCTGLDVAEILVNVGRERAVKNQVPNASFLVGDAQRYDLAPDRFDAIVSRFGVMFFDDPQAAFANIRRATRVGGTLTCIVWRGPQDNPFMVTAERAVTALLGSEEPIDPCAPGQFAFGEADRVRAILTASAWDAIDIQPIDVDCKLSKSDLAIYVRRMGRVGTILPDLDEVMRHRVTSALDEAFSRFLAGGQAHFTAACWLVRAKAG